MKKLCLTIALCVLAALSGCKEPVFSVDSLPKG